MSADRRSDREAELAVLAACVHSRIARDEARKHLVATDFDEPAHEAIWSAMAHLDRTGAGVDPAMLLSEVGVGSPAARLLPDLITWPAVPDHVADYAKVVRGWGIRRRLHSEAVHTMATALNPDVDAAALSATIAGRFAALRDSGISGDAQAVTLGELLDEADDEPDWRPGRQRVAVQRGRHVEVGEGVQRTEGAAAGAVPAGEHEERAGGIVPLLGRAAQVHHGRGDDGARQHGHGQRHAACS